MSNFSPGTLPTQKYNISSMIVFGNGSIAATTVTRYLCPGYDSSVASTTPVTMIIPYNCTLKNMYVKHNGIGGNGNNIDYVVRKNNINTNLKVTLSSMSSDGSNGVDSVYFNKGDYLDIQVNKTLSIGTSISDIIVTLEIISNY